MVFADDIVRGLLTVGRQVAVGEMIAGQALVVEDAGAFKNRASEARRPAHVDVVGSQTDDSADQTVVRKFDVGKLHISVVVDLVDHHCQLFGNRVIHTVHPAIAIWVVEAGGNFPNAKKLVDHLRKL